ncbi:hypothetical protein GSJ18_05960 [Bordetella pertussis]|uniref:Uncharacterized protein n=1 Tax=Bordetella pertussis CHLA-26 TaxID=1331284 RepID=A0AAI9J3X3_BORPT|nr:hypothetical protein [Bordetella pertussis]ETA65036.1 hypothetical protein V483_1877 [Bordetella pertussis CHLA-11]ETH13742.1 hypothetical protein L574_2030 [Bordetella pertussis STO1-SEAT-0006]ETH15768.1 hypothetical protein L575_2372 [Bordetella pertussis STO1-SEAT-0007]ETH20957.1 hypothetical protein L563_1750 [Bordetella pertussis CHLA-13]ETH31881.1 hypothetical protein L566_1875 [Bordetella pertussis CHLA-26]ETH36767.1 hypothetical protein L546_1898 [Bordetella pertussis H897]ETH3992
MNWGGGDFQFLKSGSDEPCIQPIESSQLARRRPGGPRHCYDGRLGPRPAGRAAHSSFPEAAS